MLTPSGGKDLEMRKLEFKLSIQNETFSILVDLRENTDGYFFLFLQGVPIDMGIQ